MEGRALICFCSFRRNQGAGMGSWYNNNRVAHKEKVWTFRFVEIQEVVLNYKNVSLYVRFTL